MSTSEASEVPPDDAPVPDDVVVYRLVPISWCESVNGEWEFQSGAFDNASPATEDESAHDMSVVLADTLAGLGRIPEDLPEATEWIENSEEWGVAALQTGFLRNDEAQEILRTPQEHERAHGDVRGPKSGKRRRRLKKHAWWVVRPAAPPVD